MKAEFVVVGGGISGCFAAWELARRGAEVVLLEASEIASGASGGVGLRGVRANGRDVRELPLARLAREIWLGLPREIDEPGAFTPIGQLELIERESAAGRIEAQIERQRAHGIETRPVSGGELRELEPDLSESVVAALACPDDGVSDHTATTRALARAARRLGCRIVEGAAVTEVEISLARLTAVRTRDGDRYEAGRACFLLANAGVPDLLRSTCGLTLPTFRVLPQVLQSERSRPLVRHLIGHHTRRLALKTLVDGSLMITGGWLGTWNSSAGRGEVVEKNVEGNRADAVAVYPAIGELSLELALADRVESATPDLVPIIDHVPGTTNAVFATGWSGHGWAIAPAVSRLLVDWALGDGAPLAQPLSPFGLGRLQVR